MHNYIHITRYAFVCNYIRADVLTRSLLLCQVAWIYSVVHDPQRDQVHFAGCMEADSTSMDASQTATEAAAEAETEVAAETEAVAQADAEADATVEEEEDISDRGHHSAPSISGHSQMLPYQQPLESVQLLTAQSGEDNEISSRQSLQDSLQLSTGAAADHGVELASATSQLSQDHLQEAVRAVQVEFFFTGSSRIYIPASANFWLQAPTQFLHLNLSSSQALAWCCIAARQVCRLYSLHVDQSLRAIRGGLAAITPVTGTS